MKHSAIQKTAKIYVNVSADFFYVGAISPRFSIAYFDFQLFALKVFSNRWTVCLSARRAQDELKSGTITNDFCFSTITACKPNFSWSFRLEFYTTLLHRYSKLMSCTLLIDYHSRLVSCAPFTHHHSSLMACRNLRNHHSRLVSRRTHTPPQQASVLYVFHTPPQKAGVL